MIRIGDSVQASVEDLQQALKGIWGADETSETLTEIGIGQLIVRLYFGTHDVSPAGYRKGTEDQFVQSLAILSFEDGTSAVETLTAPKSYTKKITMGVVVARQT